MSKARELSKLPNYVLSTVAELKLSVGKEQGDKAFVGGYYADGDGGGGDFYWDAVSVEADNGGTILQVTGITTGRWKRIYSGAVNVKWFGAKGDGVTDDYIAIDNAIKSLVPFTTTATAEELLYNNTYLGGAIEFENKTYRYCTTLYIPSNILLKGYGVRGSFEANIGASKKSKTVLYYDSMTTDTAAICGLNYVQQLDSSYLINTNHLLYPSGIEYDTAVYFSCFRNSTIRDLVVIANQSTLIGVSFIGGINSRTYNLCVGENKGSLGSSNAKNPKVGIFTANAWGSSHYDFSCIASVHGVLAQGNNAGSVFYSPYIARVNTDGNRSVTQVIPMTLVAHQNNSVGVKLSGDMQMISPIVEHWGIAFDLRGTNNIISSVHIEAPSAANSYCFYCEETSTTINGFSGVAGIAFFYLHTMRGQDFVELNGYINYAGYNFIDGTSAALTSKCFRVSSRNAGNFDYGTISPTFTFTLDILGDMNVPSIYLNEATGNDTYWGVTTGRPLKTLAEAISRAKILGISKITLQSNITVSSLLYLDNISIIGSGFTIALGANYFYINNTVTNTFVLFSNTIITATNWIFKFIGSGETTVKFSACTLTSGYILNGATVKGILNLITNTTNLSGIATSILVNPSILNWNSISDTVKAAFLTVGGSVSGGAVEGDKVLVSTTSV